MRTFRARMSISFHPNLSGCDSTIISPDEIFLVDPRMMWVHFDYLLDKFVLVDRAKTDHAWKAHLVIRSGAVGTVTVGYEDENDALNWDISDRMVEV